MYGRRMDSVHRTSDEYVFPVQTLANGQKLELGPINVEDLESEWSGPAGWPYTYDPSPPKNLQQLLLQSPYYATAWSPAQVPLTRAVSLASSDSGYGTRPHSCTPTTFLSPATLPGPVKYAQVTTTKSPNKPSYTLVPVARPRGSAFGTPTTSPVYRKPRCHVSSPSDDESNNVTGLVLASGRFKCATAECADLIFGRVADLRRHYLNNHADKMMEYFCPVEGCDRSRRPANKSKGRSFSRRMDKMEEHVLQMHQNGKDKKRKRPIESESDSDAEDKIENLGEKLQNKHPVKSASLQRSDTDRAAHNSSFLVPWTARYESEFEDAARNEDHADGITDSNERTLPSSLGCKSPVGALAHSFQAPHVTSNVHNNNTPNLPPHSGATNHSGLCLNSDDNERSESSSDDPPSYSNALKHFGLWTDEPNEQDSTPQNRNGTNRSSAGFLSTHSAITDSTAAISHNSLVNDTTESPGDLQVAVGNRTRGADNQRTLDLLCWHAANGINCKGKTGKSPRTRHLYKDHSLSKSMNTHKLPAPCSRCHLLFPDAETAGRHALMLRSDKPCTVLDDEEVSARNALVERLGLTESKENDISHALKNFRCSKKSKACPTLPNGCDPGHFRDWVKRNIPLYIGSSNTDQNMATTELSLWYIYFSVMFPDRPIPSNPFVKPSYSQHQRLLELLEVGWSEGAAAGLLPTLSRDQFAAFRKVFLKATDDLEVEILMERSKTSSTKPPPRKKPRLEEDTDTNTSSSNDFSFPPTPQNSYTPNHMALMPQLSYTSDMFVDQYSSSFEGDAFGMGPPPIPHEADHLKQPQPIMHFMGPNPLWHPTDWNIHGPGIVSDNSTNTASWVELPSPTDYGVGFECN